MDLILNEPLKILNESSTRDQFFSTTSKYERLQTAYEVLAPYYSMTLEDAWPKTYRQKSDEKSEKYRNAGNTMFSKSKLKESIRLYTEAILWATTGSEHLAMAFANRSAAHFDCGNFEAAITDIENALATGSYPKKLSYKLILRKGYSYKELLQLKKAEEAFVNAENLLEKSHLDEDRLIEVKGVIQEARKVLEQTKLESETTTPKSNKELYKIDNPNASIPEFSDSLKVAFKERFGRHIVASEDISVGDILAVEEAAVWRLMPNPSLKKKWMIEEKS